MDHIIVSLLTLYYPLTIIYNLEKIFDIPCRNDISVELKIVDVKIKAN